MQPNRQTDPDIGIPRSVPIQLLFTRAEAKTFQDRLANPQPGEPGEHSSTVPLRAMKSNQTLKDRRFVPAECIPGEVGIPIKGSMLSPGIRGMSDRCLETQ